MQPPSTAERLLCLLLLTTLNLTVKGQQCTTPGWFGPQCQFQCHCWDGIDCSGTDGDCPNSRCAGGWFGPQCQYMDSAYMETLLQPAAAAPFLTDGDDTTCLSAGTEVSTFFVSYIVEFEWMRIVTNTPGKFSTMTISLLFIDQYVLTSSDLKRVYVSDTVMDIHVHGRRTQRINRVNIGWTNPADAVYFCSLYVSGGRNVAIKQNTSQTSTFEDYTSNLAVDGNTNMDFNSVPHTCSQTQNVSLPSIWTMNMSHTVFTDLFIIYTRDDDRALRPNGFLLESYNGATKVYGHFQSPAFVRTLILTDPFIPQVTSVTISLNKSLTLCEVVIFGDSVCLTGNQWGRLCDNACTNCAVPTEKCYVSTGMCPSGCAVGYGGVGCQVCPKTHYGSNCLTPCSDTCVNQTCDHMTGICDKCPPGKQAGKTTCDLDCPVTFYGQDCQSQCSDSCVDKSCHPENGFCISCPPGKQLGHLTCDLEAVSGSSEVPLAAIIVPVVVILLVALVVLALFYRQRRKASRKPITDERGELNMAERPAPMIRRNNEDSDVEMAQRMETTSGPVMAGNELPSTSEPAMAGYEPPSTSEPA